MKKFLLAFLSISILATPLAMSSMHDTSLSVEVASVCVNDCNTDPTLTQNREQNLLDLEIIPLLPATTLLAFYISLAVVSLLYVSRHCFLHGDYQSLFCTYLE